MILMLVAHLAVQKFTVPHIVRTERERDSKPEFSDCFFFAATHACSQIHYRIHQTPTDYQFFFIILINNLAFQIKGGTCITRTPTPATKFMSSQKDMLINVL